MTSQKQAGTTINNHDEEEKAIDSQYEKDSYENDSARASEPGANTPFTERDTAAFTSEDQASQPSDWERASPSHDKERH